MTRTSKTGKGARRGARRADRKRAAARRSVAGRRPASRGRKSRRKPLLAEPALVAVTARAAASLKSTLLEEPTIISDETRQAAEEIDLLLDEGEEQPADEEIDDDDDELFMKPAALSGPRTHARPAAGIVGRRKQPGRAGASPRAGAAGRAPAASPKSATRSPATGAEPVPGSEHLFPRNLKTVYPVAVKAEGIWITDSSGKKYLDGCGGAVVCSIGHGVREVAKVMSAQAERLAFAHSSQFITRETMELTSRIAALAPGDMKKTGRVYLVSGGSEAIETAVKLARQYHVDSGSPGKHKIIARWQSYHGSTMGALALTGNVARRALYGPLFAAQPHIAPCYCYRCPFGLKYPSCDIACIEELEATIHQEGPETVAAFIAEPIVGATLGAVPAVDGYWKRAREICTRHNVLLIADEVMTGVGRTGRNFAIDHHGVVPDIIVAAKGLSGGYAPLGAVIARGFIADALRDGHGYFEHGFTYSAQPLAAAVGNAVLKYLDDHKLIRRAARIGKILGEKLGKLRRHRIVGEVRGAGMMWGVELVRDRKTREPFPPGLKLNRKLFEACLGEGLLIYPGSGTREGRDGDHFIIAPPFTITITELDDLLARLDRALTRVEESLR